MRHSQISCRFQPPRARRQRGVVLVTALIMLLVLTMLMVSTMRANVSEERMAGNAQDWNRAFQAAESALRDAERDVMKVVRISGVTGFENGCSSTGLCYVSATGTPVWVTLANTNDAGWLSGQDIGKSVKYGTYTASAALGGVAVQPRYIVEAIKMSYGSIKDPKFKYFYRVTAVGFGASITSRVVLQGVYRQI